jgi:hypothetical protein
MLWPTTTSAQVPLGSLTGVVRDPQELPLPGASVTLSNPATGTSLSHVTDEIGSFRFPQLPAGSYTVSASLPGFRPQTYTNVVVNVGEEYALPVQLAIGAVVEAVEVVAGMRLLATTTPEVSATVQQKQILDIPLINRDITNLIKLQAGVAGISNRANTVINGARPTWTQVTLDGINIQDNFIRTNALDFLPNRPTSDNVSEFTITTSVAGADTAGGASFVRMVTPSGTNQLRGSVYEFNRNTRFAANSFFNNSSGVEKPDLSRNQFGARAGMPLVRNRLFMFVNYEGYRQRTQVEQNLTIPANADFQNGVFRYAALDGSVRSVNVMQLSGLAIDPRIRSEALSKLPQASKVNNFLRGNSTADRILNTAGYLFNQTALTNRDQWTARFDYVQSSNQQFEGIVSRYDDRVDRTDIDLISPDRPLAYTEGPRTRFVGAWRRTGAGDFVNELRVGANLTSVDFKTDWDFSSGVLYNTVLGIDNPIGGFRSGGAPAAAFQPQGRSSNTYQLSETANWSKGRHQFQFGGSWQRNLVNPYTYAGQFPEVTFGFSAAAPASVQLTSAMFPGGISAVDLNNANLTAAFLGGVVSSVRRTFQVRDATSGFVPGIPSIERYTLDNVATYIQDNWRLNPSFTVRAGLKWEYYSPLRERNNLGLLPTVTGSITETMLSPATTLTFAKGDFYKKDLNNFGPTAGFAWDVTGDGRTAVRAGYSLSFVNEETVNVASGVGRGNAGLTTTVNLTNQYGTVNAAVPTISTPAFLSTRTLADQLALSPTTVLWGIDPNLRSPRVHQVSAGIQRLLPWKTAVEARYVGTFGRGIWRGTDLNQMRISPEFLADFQRARSNGYLSQAAGLGFVASFNPAVTGSQPLTQLPQYGNLTNATVLNRIQTNEVGGLVDFYLTNRIAGASAAFLPNPLTYAANLVANGGFSDYQAIQLEARRQLSGGFFGQLNYTWSDTLTDSGGQGQNRFEAFMDNNRRDLGTGRSFFHQTHVVNANAIYELPFGVDRKWLRRPGLLNGLVGDWQVAAILAWQSGSPFTIFSGRGTVNRPGRSSCPSGTVQICNTAFTSLTRDEMQKLVGLYKTADGRLFWINPSVIDPATGRAAGADNLTNAAGFAGQVFFNPVAGQAGNIEVLSFDGPRQFRLDMALAKRVRLGGRHALEVKAEAFNLTNTPSFFRGDMDINSATFGRLTSINVDARVMQFSLRYDF